MSTSDIYLVVDKFVKFTTKNIDIQLSQYTLFRQKVVIFEQIPSNILILNPCYANKIKDPCTEKDYKKICSVMQINNDKNKNLMLTRLLKIQRVS